MTPSQIVSSQPMAPAELINALIGIAGLALIAYGIQVMKGSRAVMPNGRRMPRC